MYLHIRSPRTRGLTVAQKAIMGSTHAHQPTHAHHRPTARPRLEPEAAATVLSNTRPPLPMDVYCCTDTRLGTFNSLLFPSKTLSRLYNMNLVH